MRPGRVRRVAAALRGLATLVIPRAVEAVVVVWLVATVVFLAMRLLPGDPAVLVLGEQADAAALARLRVRLHLDEPLYMQYARFLRGLATLDLGESLRRPGVTAARRVGDAFVPTAALGGIAVALAAVGGVGLALLSEGPWLGARRRWVDRVVTAVAGVPLLSFAPLLTYALAAKLRIVALPGDPDAGLSGLFFASGLLAVPLGAQLARLGRAALADVGRAQFLTVARAKGRGPAAVWILHALPVAGGPILTVIATQLGALLGGAVVLERLFERAGLGSLVLEAYASRDLPVLEAAVIASASLFVLTQTAASILHAAFDPRVRA